MVTWALPCGLGLFCPKQMEPAPYLSELAGGPQTAEAFFVEASDGVRIRICVWRPEAQSRGTVLLFNGRTEYGEKYGKIAGKFTGRGYTVVTADWRGQGASDRVNPDPLVGHVGQFSDYQHDADAIEHFARIQDLPKPWFLLAHSLGGAIGLRKLCRGLDVSAAVFSAPMWGIYMSSVDRVFANILPTVARWLGRQDGFAIKQTPDHYVLKTAFEDNVLTSNAERYGELQRHTREATHLGIGGPSYHWIGEALSELRDLQRTPKPDVPTLVLLGTKEQTVDPEAVKAVTSNWSAATLRVIQDGRHEMMMDLPAIQDQFLDGVFDHFEKVQSNGA